MAALPATPTVTLALLATTTLLVPLVIDAGVGMTNPLNTPLPYKTLLALPSLLMVAILPIPDTLATATLLAVPA